MPIHDIFGLALYAQSNWRLDSGEFLIKAGVRCHGIYWSERISAMYWAYAGVCMRASEDRRDIFRTAGYNETLARRRLSPSIHNENGFSYMFFLNREGS